LKSPKLYTFKIININQNEGGIIYTVRES